MNIKLKKLKSKLKYKIYLIKYYFFNFFNFKNINKKFNISLFLINEVMI